MLHPFAEPEAMLFPSGGRARTLRCESRDSMAELAPYVFLSYTTPDRVRVLTLADRLEGAGIPVWVDRRDIAGGSSWDTSIVHAIANCTVFALTCSAASLASPNVQQEVRL